MNLQIYPLSTARPGPVFIPVSRGSVLALRRQLRPTRYIGFVDPGERSPLQGRSFLLDRLRGRAKILTAPDDDQVQLRTIDSLLRFGAQLRPDDRVLVHCHHGRSRSTAAVAILVAQAHGVTAANELLQHWRGCSFHQPNRHMLRLAQALLGTPLCPRQLDCDPALRTRGM